MYTAERQTRSRGLVMTLNLTSMDLRSVSVASSEKGLKELNESWGLCVIGCNVSSPRWESFGAPARTVIATMNLPGIIVSELESSQQSPQCGLTESNAGNSSSFGDVHLQATGRELCALCIGRPLSQFPAAVRNAAQT